MSPTRANLVGQTFGRLTVKSYYQKPGNNPSWLCLCSCGTEKIIRGDLFKKGLTQSCGCLAKEVAKKLLTTHSATLTPEYTPWASMLRRCNNPQLKEYHLYGGKGIKVCERWHDFLNFFADMGKKPFHKAIIERINPLGNFEPSNCRWGMMKKRKVKSVIRQFPDITNQIFGKLTAISFHSKANNSKAPLWLFACSCGNQCIKSQSVIKQRRQQSCGCPIIIAKRHSTHGMSNTKEFKVWCSIKERCFSPKVKAYKDYGARGITICDRWQEAFLNFYNDMGALPSPDHTIERIDHNGNYEPSNCKWIHKYDQAANKRNNHVLEFNGKRLHLAAWARELGVDKNHLFTKR